MPPTPASKRSAQRKAAVALAQERARRRELILEYVARGMDRADIAHTVGVSLRTVFREVNRALDERRPLATNRYLRLQVERLNRTLVGLDRLLHEEGDVRAAAPLLAILDRLDRFHGLQTLAPPEPSRPRAIAHAPSLALSRQEEAPDPCPAKPSDPA